MPQNSATLSKNGLATRPTVHELQELAREAAKPRRRRTRALSRAAQLYLIDILSRWGGSGLALFAGVAIFVAISAGEVYPFRAAVWLLLVLAALYVCRSLRLEFRTGERVASRPFRWRANYTSGLVALSAAFGAGAVIIVPDQAPSQLAFESIALLLAGSFGAGLLHAGHAASAAAAAVPAAVFITLGAWRAGGASAGAVTFAAAAIGAAALYFLCRFLWRRASDRFPRTSLLRQEIDHLGMDASEAEPAQAHA